MANIVTQTEAFTHADWSNFGLTITANTDVAPAFAGINAGLADSLADVSGSQDSVYSTYRTVPNDSSDWITTLYVRKIFTTPTFFPEIVGQFAGGTGISFGISINLQTGQTAKAAGESDPATHSSVDVDSLWWRFFMKQANNGTGNTVLRMGIFPARAATLGGGADGAVTGTITVWGANQTNGSTLLTYEPDPYYDFVLPTPTAVLARRTYVPHYRRDVFRRRIV